MLWKNFFQEKMSSQFYQPILERAWDSQSSSLEMIKRFEKDAATCVLIISPNASIISDQIAEMQLLGFNALELSEKILTKVT